MKLTKLAKLKSTMNLSFGKCNGRDHLKKSEWGIGEQNEGNDGNAGNQGGNDENAGNHAVNTGNIFVFQINLSKMK